jgi:hypothetical protein
VNKNVRNSDTDTLSDERVSQMLSSLGTVEPPPDFNIRVRSRIAAGRPSIGLFSGFRFAMAGATMAAVAVTAGYIGITQFSNSPDTAADNMVAAVEQPQTPAAVPQPVAVPSELPEPAVVPMPLARSEQVARTFSVPALPAVRNASNVRNTSVIRPTPEDLGGGSFDEAVREATVIRPEMTPAVTQISMDVILRQLGVSGGYADGGFRVTSAAGLAARASVEPGDVILSVNGLPVRAGARIDDGTSLRRLSVRRDGRVIELSLAR